MSWRGHIKVHPAADLFPMMPEPELRELGEDIKKNGLLSPIVIHDEMLLDGRNRLDAMELVGIEFELVRAWKGRAKGRIAEIFSDDIGIDPDDGGIHRPIGVDPYAYVLGANTHRRHLTSEQKRELITKVLKAKPETSNATVAKQVKADDKTVAKVRRELESTSEIPKLEKTVGADGKTRKQPKARPKKTPKSKPVSVTRPEVTESPERIAESQVIDIEQRRAVMAALAEGTMGDACVMRLKEAEVATMENFEPETDEDPAGFVVAVVKNATEKAQIVIRNLQDDLTKSERAEIVEAIFALIRKWKSVIRKLEPNAGGKS